MRISDKDFEPYIGADELQRRVAAVAGDINRDLQGESPVFVGMLNGAFMFFADLMKHVSLPCEVAFMRFSSYLGTASSGRVERKSELACDIAGRTVVVVEDIVESGLTIQATIAYLQTLHPKEIRVATMFFKPQKLKVAGLPVRYVGMEIGDDFIVGYGLDYNELGRNLGEVYKIVR